MRFSVFWPCAGNASFCAPRILSEGTIEPDSHRKFAAFMADKSNHLHELPPKPDVCFNSFGGDLAGAIQLGQQIRKLGFDTCLAPQYTRVIPGSGVDQEVFVGNVICASACAFALVGGVNRFIESDSRYGIHQFYGTRGDIGDSATQVTVVALAAYLEEMGVSRSLLDAASLVPSREMYWLSAEELRQLRVDNMAVANAQWQLNALNDGTVIANIVQIKPGPQSRISLTLMKSAARPVLVTAFVPGEDYRRSLADALDALNGEPVSLRVDGQQIAAYQAVPWNPAKEGVVAVLPLEPTAVQSLRYGKVLELKVSVARVFDQYDPSLDFPLQGVGRFLTAVLK
jgi:hypothetical protein